MDLLISRSWKEWSLWSRRGIGRYSIPLDWTSYHPDMLLFNSYVPLLIYCVIYTEYWYTIARDRILLDNVLNLQRHLCLMTALDSYDHDLPIYTCTFHRYNLLTLFSISQHIRMYQIILHTVLPPDSALPHPLLFPRPIWLDMKRPPLSIYRPSWSSLSLRSFPFLFAWLLP